MTYGICTWKKGELSVEGEAHDRNIAEGLRNDLAQNPAHTSPLFVTPLTKSTEAEIGQHC